MRVILGCLILVLIQGCAMREYGLINQPFPEVQGIDLDAVPQTQTLSEGSLFSDQNAISGFQISQTWPALFSVSDSGGKVGLPGCHPEGISSPVF